VPATTTPSSPLAMGPFVACGMIDYSSSPFCRKP
jgi:hypothetical protein